MKKHIAACAALAALTAGGASAQTASLYGLIDMSVVSAKEPGAKASTTAAQSGNMTTSFWGLKVNDSLGGGLKAEAQIEGFLLANTGTSGRFSGDPLFSRTASVGLSGGFGSVTLGRITNSLFVNNLLFNAFGDSFGFSPAIKLLHLSAGQATGDTGWNDSVKWTSPTIQGTTLSVHQSVKGARPGANLNVSALYFRGPISAGASWQEVRRRDGGGIGAMDSDAWQIGAAYDAKFVKLFGQFGTVDNLSNRLQYDHWGVGAAVPVTAAGKVLLQYNQMEPSNARPSKTASVGYNHFVSQRTDLYAVLMNEKTPAASGSTYGLGIRHRF